MGKFKIDKVSNIRVFSMKDNKDVFNIPSENIISAKIIRSNMDIAEGYGFVRCKDCKYRYNEYNCPLAEYHESSSEDEYWDYWYTYGRSEDDDFFCADGEYSEEYIRQSETNQEQ